MRRIPAELALAGAGLDCLDQQEAFADATIAQVEGQPGAHPMQLDISLDQLALLRPTRRLSGRTVPGVSGLFTCGASTAPVGGIAGSSGKAAALELLKAQP